MCYISTANFSDLQSVLEDIVDSLRDDDEGFISWETFVCWRDDDKGIGPDECGCTLCSEGGIADVEEDAGEKDGESTN